MLAVHGAHTFSNLSPLRKQSGAHAPLPVKFRRIWPNFGRSASPATVLTRMATGAPAAGSLWQGVLGHALAHAWVALGMVTRVLTMLMAAFTNISPLSGA